SLAEAIGRLVGHPVSIAIQASNRGQSAASSLPKSPSKPTAKERMERLRQIEAHPWVQACVETFDAEIVKVDPHG
ncbi:MAG: hypothetical protein AAGJ83_12180, partial [Planctomycetota bacterium]